MSAGSNWAGIYDYRASVVHHPTTLEELQRVVAAAPRIRALGTRHSFNGLADSSELVSLDAMPANVRIDPESETVTVSGGVRYGELGVALQRAGWALRNLASLPHISVAGAISTSTHGSGDHNGTLARAVSGLTLVTADGSLRSITPAHDEFDGAVVSLGALGIIHNVTLDIEPTFDVRQDIYPDLGWDAYLENFDRITARAYSVSTFTSWAGDRLGTVLMKSRMDAPAPPQALYGTAPATSERGLFVPEPSPNVTEQGGVPGPWIDRLPHFRLEFTPSRGDEIQSEYLVPRRHALAAISAVRALSDRITPVLHVTEIRTMAADSLWLSGAYETDAVGIHFTWKKLPEQVLPLLPVVEEVLAPFDARPHWGKVFHTPRLDLYPRLDDFVALANEFDPAGKFRNEFLEASVFS